MPKKVHTGKVVSDRMDKTVVVMVTTLVKHPRYKKIIKKVEKFKAHNPENSARVGDTVEIIESRPLSRDKRWTVVAVTEKA